MALAMGMRRRRRDAHGAMPLASHLHELRRRLTVCVAAVFVGACAAWSAYAEVFDRLTRPLQDAMRGATPGSVTLAMAGVAEPFTLRVQVSAVMGLIVATPVCSFQLWRFASPGLHRRERRWVWLFMLAAVPLFALGIWLGYRLMPQALGLLMGFTPEGVSNIIPVSTYLTFVLRMLLVFGVAFQLPVFIVTLNAAGVVTARTLLGWWRQIIIGVLLFAAVATPTGDPVNMLALALPMLLISTVAIAVCALLDRRRGRTVARDPWSDDVASPLDSSS